MRTSSKWPSPSADGQTSAGPLAHQLAKALDQAQHHAEAGRVVDALDALDRATRLLSNPKKPDTLSDAAASRLTEMVGLLRASLAG